MKKFEIPEIEVELFAIEDVITTSEAGEGGEGAWGENEMPR